MILDFRAKDYICRYYAGSYYYDTICFSSGCDKGIIDGYAHITYIWPKKEQMELNYCFFDKKTLFEYFAEISKLLGFHLIAFTETTSLYKLQIKCMPDHRYFIYVSTYIRYVYESPFALLLCAAWQNRANFPELDIVQIMQFYLALFFNGRRCHCPGEVQMMFQNINTKCQFNIIKDNFNYSESFLEIKTNYISLARSIIQFNTKQLPQIVSGINFIANRYYDENKKYICRW